MKQGRIKVLHVVNNLGLGGIEKLVYELACNIPSKGYSLEVCCVRAKAGEWLREIEAKGIPVHFFCDYRKHPFKFFKAYRRFLHEANYQAVHVHLNHLSGLFLYHPAKLVVPVRIAHYHNDFSAYGKVLRKKLLLYFFKILTSRYATVNIGISGLCLASVFGERWRSMPKVKKIYNGIDLEKFSSKQEDRNSIRKEIGIEEGAIIIGHVGRFRLQKNHAFIIELASQICPRFENLVFLLVGDGKLQHAMKGLVRRNVLDKKIFFTGARTDVPALMSAMDMFILPSLWEGFGLTVIEAQAAGLPVIVSDNVPAEIPLLDGSKRIPLEDMLQWIDACELLIHTQKMPESGEKRIPPELRPFSLKTWVKSITALYD